MTSLKRLAIASDVPTLNELGFNGVDVADWKVVVGPAGMPVEIVKSLHLEIQSALMAQDTIEKLALEGAVTVPGSTEAARIFIQSEQKRWGALVTNSGATAD